MIHFILASHSEAKPLIEYYKLKKILKLKEFNIFIDNNNQISLTISGLGKVASACSVIYTYSYFKKKMPSGRITQSLLNDYKIGISTVMMNRKFFFKKKFNKNYNIIGDFDFFINLSLQENFYCIQKPLIYFRKHKNNYSKKIYTYLRELDDWSKKNLNKLKKANISLNKFRFFCYKLKLKKAFGWGL